MCAGLFYIPQKVGGPTGMSWQWQDLTQVAQGGEQEGLLKAKSLAPSSQFMFNPGEEDVGGGLLHLPLPSSLWGKL